MAKTSRSGSTPRGDNAERSRRYRKERFAEIHGITHSAARRLARRRSGSPSAPARAAKESLLDLRNAPGLLSAESWQLERRALGLEGLRQVRSAEAKSVAEAERKLNLPRGFLREQFPTAFDARGRIKAGDREPMLMRIAGRAGDTLSAVRGSRKRRLVAEHRNTAYLVIMGQTPPAALDRFDGLSVAGVPLETDPERLVALWRLGRLREGPYAERRP